MSELERLHQARMARQAEQPNGERRDPTEWTPRDNSTYERVDDNMLAESMRSEPLNYQSIAHLHPTEILGIEATAKVDLIRAMDAVGLYPDERGVRVHWQLVAEGHGFRMPEGFVHPDAPDDVKREGRESWKRVVEIASDSLQKFIFVKVWRKKWGTSGVLEPARVALMVKSVADLPAGEASTMTIPILDGPDPDKYDRDYTRPDDDIVDGEIVDEDE